MTQRVSPMVTWGLLLAWAVHDTEELITIPGWTARARSRLQRRLPFVPARLWRRLDADRAHTALALGAMGCLVATAARAGARTNGASPLYQAVLSGFGAHAGIHLASAAVTGGYTPGLVTTPTVVIPFSWWAHRELRRAHVPRAELPTTAYAALPASIAGAHAVASGVLHLVRRGRRVSRSAR